MRYPFMKHVLKDFSKVRLCFFKTDTLEEKLELLDVLLENGYLLMSDAMKKDESLKTLAIPTKGHGYIGYGNIYVMAEQTYHGAKIYKSVDVLIADILQSM